MPKPHISNISIRLDLLRPQSNPEKLLTRLLRWLLSSGRYIFVFVEAVVLIAFIARFKLDSDLATINEAIDEEIPYVEALKPNETQIRQTQLKLTTIDSFRSNYVDYSQLLKKISDQTPAGVKISSLNFERDMTKVTIQLNASTQNNNELATLIGGLKQDPAFSDIVITAIGFEKGTLTFSLRAQANLSGLGETL